MATIGDIAPISGTTYQEHRKKRSFGTMLSDMGAAYKGRQRRSEREFEQLLKQETLQMERARLGINTLNQVIEMTEGMDEAQASQVIQSIAPQFEELMPGFSEIAQSARTDPKSRQKVEQMGYIGDLVIADAGGDWALAAQLLDDDNYMKYKLPRLQQRAAPKVKMKIANLMSALEADMPEEARTGLTVGEDGKPVVTTADLPNINRFLPQQDRLNDTEMAVAQNTPEIVQPYGILTSDLVSKQAQAALEGTEEKVLDPDDAADAAKLATSGVDLGRLQLDPTFRSAVEAFRGKEGSAEKYLASGKSEGIRVVTRPDGTTETIIGGVDDDKEKRKRLTQRESSTRVFLHESSLLYNKVANNPDLTTTVGGLSELSGALGANIQTVANLFGTELDLSGGLDWRKYDDEFFGDLAGARSEVKAAAFNLGVMWAVASGIGSSGRMTDKDVQLSLRQVGADVDDPDQLKPRLKEVSRQVRDRFLIEYETETRSKFQGDLPPLPGSNPYKHMTDEEFQAVDYTSFDIEQLEEYVAEEKRRGRGE